MAVAMKPALFAACCIATLPAVYALAFVATTVWYNKIYLPRIAGDE